MRKLSFAIVSVLVFSLVFVFIPFVNVQPANAQTDIRLTLPDYFSQVDDSRWANEPLGFWPPGSIDPETGLPYTIGNFGCFITSVAMIYNYYCKGYTNPLELNERLKQTNGYVNNGEVIWGDYGSPPGVHYSREGQESKIRTELEAGRPVLADVYSSQTNKHAVVIIGTSGSDYLIVDPQDGKEHMLGSGYWGAYTIRTLRFFEGRFSLYKVVYEHGGYLYSVNLDGTNLKQLTSTSGYRYLRFSHDGNMIVCSYGSLTHFQIWVMDSDGQNQHKLTNSIYYSYEPSFSPNDDKITFRRDDYNSTRDIWTMSISGGEEGAKNIQKTPDSCEYEPNFLSNGRIIFLSDRANPGVYYHDIYVMDSDGQNVQRLTYTNKLLPEGLSSSPDDKITFVNNGQIWTMNVDGSNQQQLTNSTFLLTMPAFSSDGRKIVYSDGGSIYIMDSDGQNARMIIGSDFTAKWDPACYFYWLDSSPIPPSDGGGSAGGGGGGGGLSIAGITTLGTLQVSTNVESRAPNKKASFEVISYPEGTKRVLFLLDGKVKRTDKKPPFTASIKIKSGTHVITIIALGKNKIEIGRTEIQVTK